MKKRTLKLLSYLLTVCMLVSSISMSTFAAPFAFLSSENALDDTTYVDGSFIGDGNDEDGESTVIKNIIFLIPDGAGYGSLDFSNDVKMAGGFDDTKFPYKTVVDDSPMTLFDYHAGSMISLNVYNAMTDSAAAGTALSTGYKTINNYLGIDRRKMPHANLTEAAQSVGKATGLVSTYEWPHATPASFAVHSLQRTDYADFYRQIENKDLQVVLGAGYGTVESYGGNIQTAIDKGYTIIDDKYELAQVQPGDKIWGNIATSSFDFDIYNKESTATLAEMTDAAIRALSADEDGFFLMVEGSMVDTGGHSNNTAQMSSDYIAFDAAFEVAVEFAKSRTDTVVVAVPDHDTGGLYYDALVASGNLDAAVAETQSGKNSDLVTWESGSHTTQDVPFWCYYPEGITGIEGAADFGKDYYQNPVRTENVIDNTDIAPWCANLMGVDLDELTSDLFVNVTDIGIYDSASQKFTFNNGDKYAFKDQAVYYKDGVETPMFGQMIVIEGVVYVPREIIDEKDWDYVTEDFDGITGAGTKTEPYVIDDAWDFLEFTNNMIAGIDYSGCYFVQNADIDMTNKPAYNGVLSDVNFAGYYDGKGYTLTVNIDTTEVGGNAVIFGVNNGTIVNLGVNGDVKSASGYAAFVRKNNSSGKIVNCFSNINVSASGSTGNGFTISNYGKIENSYFGGKASHYAIAASGTMTNVYFVEGSSTSLQTIATSVTADAAKTTLAGTLAGGLSSAAATLGGTTEDLNTWQYIDGTDYPVLKLKLPEVTGITVTPTAATVKRGESVTFKTTVLGNYNPSQAVVWNISPAPESEETKLFEDGFFKIGADETVSQFTIQVKAAFGGAYTASTVVNIDLASAPVIKEDGTRTHPYLIENEDDFMEFTTNVNNGVSTYNNVYFKQTADIDMDGYEGYIGMYSNNYFCGVYDGDGHTINVNIYVERDEKTEIDDVCIFGYISSARILNLGVTGSIKAPGYVSTFARNMGSASLFANCWSTAHIESIATGFGKYPGNDASGYVRSPYSGAFVNCYFAGTLISPSGTSYPFGGTGSDYQAVYYNNYYLGQVSFEDEEQTEFTEEELEEGFAHKLNAGRAAAAEFATATNTKNYVYTESMLLEWVDEIGGPRHRERDDAQRIEYIEGNTYFKDIVIGSDVEVVAEDNVLEIDSLIVKDGFSLTLGRGTYIFGDVSGDVFADDNANVIITGNAPSNYVEIDLGEKEADTNERYAEVGGFQYSINEYNNLYGVLAENDMLVEITEKADFYDEDTVTTSYYFVDASKGKATKLMSDFVMNKAGRSLRYPDEKTNNSYAMRFRAEIDKASKIETESYEITEYGYIIALEKQINNNGAQLNFDFSVLNAKAPYVTGVAYSKADNIDKIYESEDEYDSFTGVLYNIPENYFGCRIVAKTYTKIEIDGKEFVVYGEPMTSSLYSIAKALIDSGTVTNESQIQIVNSVITTTVDASVGSFEGAGASFGALYE